MALLGSMIGLMMTLTLMMVRYSVLLIVWMLRLIVLLGQMCVAGANAAAYRARSTRR
jgi:hypothetical protein